MINTRLNELQGYKTSYLVNAKTVSGEPVLKLDRDCDGQVGAHEPVLVIRDSRESDQWRPVKNVDDLKKFLEATPDKERGVCLGYWRDRRNFLFKAADGKIQSREVTTIGGPPKELPTLRGGKKVPPHAETLWNTEKFHSISTKEHYEHEGAIEYTAYHYTKVDPARLQIGTAETPAGTVATFEEPQVVSRTHVEQVTCFAKDGNHFVPMAFKDTDYTGYLD
ncbi:MAG: hypothetical protein J0I12_17600 [Candidatus Eremiobacteraeota bacterium]|nr:hypothetical protein [Candidatus Eremiobacteraeota bacterium]